VAAGVVIGASAVYFLEPENGREHRERLVKLVA
jgi:gas vesicle protein